RQRSRAFDRAQLRKAGRAMGARHTAHVVPAGELGAGGRSARRKATLPCCLGRQRQDGCRMTVEQGVFLVGGLGTRLHALTRNAPKPALDVGSRPFLDHLLDEASRHGLKRALLLCGHRAADLVAAYDGRVIRGMTIETAVEREPAGTAGALSLAVD